MKRYVYFAGLYAGSAALLKAGGFLLSLWMARTLPVAEYGAWGLLYAFQTGLTTFGLVGILEAVVGLLRSHDTPEARRALFGGATGAFLVTISASLIIAIAIAPFVLGQRIGLLAIACVLVSGALLAFAALQAQIVRLEERHLASLGFNFGVPLVGLASSTAWFIAERSAQSFFVGSAVGLVVAMAALWRAGKVEAYSVARHGEQRRQVMARLAPYVVVAFFGWLSGYGNNFVVTSLFPATEVARFTFALSLGSVMQLVASALNQVWSPRFFLITQSEPFDTVEDKNRRFFFSQSVVLGLIAALSIVLLPPLLKALGGNLAFYASMKLELFFVFAAYIVLSPWWHCHNYFLAYDRGPSVMNIVLITSAVGIVLWLALMWLLGPLGIYIGFFSQMVVRSIGIVLFARGFWPVRVGWGGVATGMLVASGGLWVAGV